MSNIEGVGPSHENVPTYKQEFDKGVELFKDSLDQYQKADEPHKKAAFKKVMSDALKIMNHSAKAALGEGVQAKEKKLEGDYNSFLNHDCQATRQQLEKDLDDIKGDV